MTLVSLQNSILLLELSHFRIISDKERELPFPSDYHLNNLGSIIHSVNYKADTLGLTIEQIASEYFVRICCGHKLVDGNKRMAVISFGYFLEINKCSSAITKTKLRNLAITLSHEETSNVPVEVKVEYFHSIINGSFLY